MPLVTRCQRHSSDRETRDGGGEPLFDGGDGAGDKIGLSRDTPIGSAGNSIQVQQHDRSGEAAVRTVAGGHDAGHHGCSHKSPKGENTVEWNLFEQ